VLYHLLYQYLSESYTWLNVFKYQTFRAMASFFFSFVFVLALEPIFIAKLGTMGVKGQPIRDDGPAAHHSKQGTPTMGGLVIILSVAVSSLLFCDLTTPFVWLSLAVMFGYAAIGFVDDWRKVTQQNSKGLSEREKLLYQSAIAGGAAALLLLLGFSSNLTVPFLKDIVVPLGILFVPFVMLVVVGTSNAVNLTDGLDGLAIGPVMTVAFTYAVFAHATGHFEIAKYLQLQHISGLGEISVILAALFAGGLGFLWYNTFPAQIFLGDTGALALGGILGFVAVLVKQEIVLIIAGGIFVMEALSVIIQRYSYKLRKKRVFRMAPIHHHFELKGWAEPTITVRFWIISIVLALASLSTLKLR
jgi:phospho-N-acetylmuramoyl-pentapeptide-transferase